MRHTGAGGLACSSTVKINVFIPGENLDLFVKVVRLDADGPADALFALVVIAVAADVGDHDVRRTLQLDRKSVV